MPSFDLTILQHLVLLLALIFEGSHVSCVTSNNQIVKVSRKHHFPHQIKKPISRLKQSHHTHLHHYYTKPV